MRIFQRGLLRIFISIHPKKIGGGSNTFAYNFSRWMNQNRNKVIQEKTIGRADLAIIIAGSMDPEELRTVKRNCFVIHRLDEFVEEDETGFRKQKHEKIRELNKLADITVYQSEFVFHNMHPYLGKPAKYEIIHNGGSTDDFFPAEKSGNLIGHVTWGVGEKKRLDILHHLMITNSQVDFLLVGRQNESDYDFSNLPNVQCTGPVKRDDLLKYYHRMQFLLFPSENDPCPNTVIEAMLSGLPVCYNKKGGTVELVKDCGVTLDEFSQLVDNVEIYRKRVLKREDLDFHTVGTKYLALYPG